MKLVDSFDRLLVAIIFAIIGTGLWFLVGALLG